MSTSEKSSEAARQFRISLEQIRQTLKTAIRMIPNITEQPDASAALRSQAVEVIGEVLELEKLFNSVTGNTFVASAGKTGPIDLQMHCSHLAHVPQIHGKRCPNCGIEMLML